MIVPLLIAAALFCIGLVLSAFFSGMETGFYRVTRLRVALDARAGDRIASWTWWLINNPAMFVSTTLVGNNLANYMVSLATVTAARLLFAGTGHLAEMLLPLLVAPLVFVLGELLPKRLFYDAPGRLLRVCGPFYFLATVLLIVPSSLLWAMGHMIHWLCGQESGKLNLALARAELGRMLDEGHDAGVLRPGQRTLAQGLLSAADKPVENFATPAARLPRVRLGMSRADVLRLARRQRASALAVEEPLGRRRLIGYVSVIDLIFGEPTDSLPIREMMEFSKEENHLSVLMKMQAARQEFARVVDEQRNTIGIITVEQLTTPLFRGA